jgi:hypothetical protein
LGNGKNKLNYDDCKNKNTYQTGAIADGSCFSILFLYFDKNYRNSDDKKLW